jgi:hypothetical protein
VVSSRAVAQQRGETAGAGLVSSVARRRTVACFLVREGLEVGSVSFVWSVRSVPTWCDAEVPVSMLRLGDAWQVPGRVHPRAQHTAIRVVPGPYPDAPGCGMPFGGC